MTQWAARAPTASPIPCGREQPSALPLEWSRIDAWLLSALSLAALGTRLWRLGQPGVIIFDEMFTVSQARGYLLHAPYRESHPPVSSLLIALSIWIFGDQAWSWRLPGAIVGSALAAVTYLLARRLFGSRPAALLAAGFVICDGLFLVDSRVAVWEIFYVASGTWAYLMLFRFEQTSDRLAQRRSLVWMGVALGLCMGSKLLIPAFTELLVLGFAAYWMAESAGVCADSRFGVRSLPLRRIAAMLALAGGMSALVYMLVLLPNYWFGWWHSVADQVTFYRTEFHYQSQLTAKYGRAPWWIPYYSPWWSWPFLLRPLTYWVGRNFFLNPYSIVEVIISLGNPIIWWGVLVSIPITAAQAISRRSAIRTFLVVGYAMYLGIWAAIPRYQFIYHYMPALYLGILSLAGLLADCWAGEAERWEQMALLASLAAPLAFGFGQTAGLAAGAAIAIAYWRLQRRDRLSGGRFVCVAFASATLAAFVYFFPIWTGLPITRTALKARMWLHGPGMAKWN